MRACVGKTAPPLKTHHNTGMGMKGDAVRERP